MPWYNVALGILTAVFLVILALLNVYPFINDRVMEVLKKKRTRRCH